MKRRNSAVGVRLSRGQVQALQTMALVSWAGHSQNRPPGQGTQMGRGLQVVRAVPGPQEATGRLGRHDLEGEGSWVHGLRGSLGKRKSSDYYDFPVTVFNDSEHLKNHLVLPPRFTKRETGPGRKGTCQGHVINL